MFKSVKTLLFKLKISINRATKTSRHNYKFLIFKNTNSNNSISQTKIINSNNNELKIYTNYNSKISFSGIRMALIYCLMMMNKINK